MDIQKGQFETITADGLTVPIVVALTPTGRPVPLAGDVEPAECSHLGATWSSDLDLRCSSCGAPMFLPPRLLARKTADELVSMYGLWRAAGCPPWYPQALNFPAGWGIVPQYWRVTEVAGFGSLGGLPVQLSRLDRFELARREFEL